MSTGLTSIAYISRSASEESAVAASLKKNKTVSVTQHAGALSEINGQAVEFAQGHDLVVFEAGNDPGEDIKAIALLRAKLPRSTSIVAVASPDVSLADIRKLTSAGVDDVIPDTIETSELTSQVQEWLMAHRALAAPVAELSNEGKVIAVSRARGGIGATTVAVNVADTLLDKQGTFKKKATSRVALVDFDVQFGTIASNLDVPGSEGFFQMLLDGTNPDETFMQSIVTELDNGLTVLPAPSKFVPLDSMTQEQVGRIIELLRATHDFVVIDMPHALVDWVSAVLDRCDTLLLVTDSSVPSIHQAKRLIDFYTSENLSLDVQIVINHEKKPMIQKRHHSEASKVLDRNFQHWLPFDPKSAREASDRGVPMSEAAGSSPLTKSICKLGRALAAKDKQTKSRT